MRNLRLLGVFVFLSVSLYAVPKYFYIRTFGTPDGAQYDAQRNLIYVSSPQTSQVLAVAADTGQVQKSVFVPNAAGLDITRDGKQLVVGTTAYGGWYGNSFLTFIDLDTFTISERIPINNPLRQQSGGELTVYSPFIRKVLVLSNGNILFTAAQPDLSLSYLGEFDIKQRTFSLLLMGGYLFVPSQDRTRVLLPGMGFNAGLQIFDVSADAITTSNPQLSNTSATFSHDGKLVAYVADQSHTLILDSSTLQTIRTIATPTAGGEVAFSLDDSKVYIQKFAYPDFYVFDVNTGLLQGTFSVPGDDHDSVRLLLMDSRGMLYTSLDRGLAVTDPTVAGFFDPQTQSYDGYPYVASPSSGPITGGTAVTLGDHYTGRPTVYFADKVATITGTDGSGIHVTAPPGDRAGPVDITVRYDDGYVAYIAEGFSYGPSIEYLDHDSGPTSGGDAVTLFALGLKSFLSSDVHVQIGGTPATITSVDQIGISPMKSPTYRIRLTTPSGTAGSADVVLTTADGSSTLPGGFNYVNISNLGTSSTVSQMLYDGTRGNLIRCTPQFSSVDILDTTAGQTIKHFNMDANPLAMAFSPDHNTLYVTTGAGFIDVIDLNTYAQKSIQVNLPTAMTMTRIGVTSKGTLFVGIFNPNIIYDSRLLEVDPSNGTFTTRLQNFNGNVLEIGMSRDGTRAFISSDLQAGASGNTLYYWDAFTDTFRPQFVPGWQDYGIDDSASLLIGGSVTYDSAFDIHNAFDNFDFDFASTDYLVFGEKLDDSGALAFQPSLHSLSIYDVHRGSRVAHMSLPSQSSVTLDAMTVDSGHGVAYIASNDGLLKVQLPNLLSIGRIEPAQGLTAGGQNIIVRGFGFQQHATVSIAGIAAQTTFVNSTTLQVITPALPLGSAAVQVQNDDGRVYTVADAYSAVDTQPILAATSPSVLHVNLGGLAQTIAVVGMNFSPGAVVLWNGSPRTTSFLEDTELDVTLSLSDTVAVGAATLAVRNPDGGISNQITIPIKDYPQVSFPQNFGFVPQVVNTSSPIQTGTVTNSGTSSAAVSFSAPAPFTFATDCLPVIAAGTSCTLSVGFNPTTPGTYDSAITVRGDVSDFIPLHGVAGLAAATLTAVPSQLTFPTTNKNTQSDANVIVTNIGVPDVTITGVSTDNTEFGVTSYLSPTISSGQYGPIAVRFVPAGAGTRTGNLFIDSSAGRITVPLKGTAAQRLGFDSDSLTVQAIKGQTSPTKVVATFTNTGGIGANISFVSLTTTSSKTAFSQTNDCPAVLNAGSSCRVTVSYLPSTAPPDTAYVSVAADGFSYTLQLTGAVTDFAVAGNSLTSTVTAGQTATYPISIDATGGYRGNLTFSCSGAPAYSSCSVNPQAVTVAGATTPVSVSVTTTARTSGTIRWPMKASLAFMCFGLILLARSRKPGVLMLVVAISILASSGCGGGGSGGTSPPPPITGTPAGTYTLTVTATTPDGAARNLSLTLKVN